VGPPLLYSTAAGRLPASKIAAVAPNSALYPDFMECIPPKDFGRRPSTFRARNIRKTGVDWIGPYQSGNAPKTEEGPPGYPSDPSNMGQRPDQSARETPVFLTEASNTSPERTEPTPKLNHETSVTSFR